MILLYDNNNPFQSRITVGITKGLHKDYIQSVVIVFVMVLLLVGSSENGAHVWSKSGILIC